jgi:ribosomal protein S18 acetylase RimI-like enzyme
MTITIINAPTSLKPKIEALCKQTYADHQRAQPYAFASNLYDLGIQPEINEAFNDVSGSKLDTSPVIFAAMRNNEFLGYIRLSSWSRPGNVVMPNANIDDIYVVSGHHGTGVGDALLNHAKAMADERDWDNLTATVWACNPASQALFERSGFTMQNTTMRYGPDRQSRDYPAPELKSKRVMIKFFETAPWIAVGFCLHFLFLRLLG